MTDFNQYKKSGTSALYTQIPIQYLEEFRFIMSHFGKYYKIRYRGPRNTPLDYGRSGNSKSTTCLKGAAKSFSVYQY